MKYGEEYREYRAILRRKNQRKRAKRAKQGHLLMAVFVAAVLLLLTFHIYSYSSDTDRVLIDGEFDDWDRDALYKDRVGEPDNDHIDIVRFGGRIGDDVLYLYLEVAGRLFNGTALGGDTVQVFIDVDNSERTGYSIRGIGADHLVEIYGRNGEMITGEEYFFNKGKGGLLRRQNDYGGWDHIGRVLSSKDGYRIEIVIPYYNGKDINLFFRTMDMEGNDDMSMVVPLEAGRSPGDGPLVVKYGTMKEAEGTIGDGVSFIMWISLEAPRSPVTVDRITVVNRGTAYDQGLVVYLVDGTADVASAAFKNGTAVMELNSLNVKDTRSLTMRVFVDGARVTQGRVLSLVISRVKASTKAVTLSGAKGSWYLMDEPSDHVVDGLFDEWGQVRTDETGETGVGGNTRNSIDISKYGSDEMGNETYFYISTVGEILDGSLVPNDGARKRTPGRSGKNWSSRSTWVGIDTFRIFIRGYDQTNWYNPPDKIGFRAGYMLVIEGQYGEPLSGILYEFRGNTSESWSWKEMETEVRLANGQNELEASVAMDLEVLDIYVNAFDWRGRGGDHAGT